MVSIIGKYDKKHNSVVASEIRLEPLSEVPKVEPIYHSVSGISSKQISTYINELLKLCKKALLKNEMPVSALIVKNNKVIAKAYLEGRDVTDEEMTEATIKNGKPKPKKGDWGYVFKGEDGKYYISVNFQIRFV